VANFSVTFKGCDTASINLPATHPSPIILDYLIGSPDVEFNTPVFTVTNPNCVLTAEIQITPSHPSGLVSTFIGAIVDVPNANRVNTCWSYTGICAVTYTGN